MIESRGLVPTPPIPTMFPFTPSTRLDDVAVPITLLFATWEGLVPKFKFMSVNVLMKGST